MAEWKKELKNLARGFCVSQVKVNKILKRVERTYGQPEREIPKFYKGNREAIMYDTARREIMSLVFA